MDHTAHALHLRIVEKIMSTERGMRLFNWFERQTAFLTLKGAANHRVEIARRERQGSIRTRIYAPMGTEGPLPVVVYYHGGGYSMGMPEGYHALYKRLMEIHPCIIIAPDYRRSIEAPYPAGHDDCYDALLWARDHVAEYGGDPSKIVIMGDSAGGGMTVGVALRARDEGDVQISAMVPMYPMLDDRPENWTHVNPKWLLWKPVHNRIGWRLWLQGQQGEIAPHAAPARAADLRGLPPTLSFVGQEDLFHDEVVTFMNALKAAQVPVTFETFSHTFHAMENLMPEAPRSKDIQAWFAQEFSALIKSL